MGRSSPPVSMVRKGGEVLPHEEETSMQTTRARSLATIWWQCATAVALVASLRAQEA